MSKATAAILALIAFSGWDSSELPDNVAAQVGDPEITTAAIDRAAVGRIAIGHSAATMPAYLPTDVKRCVAVLRRRSGGDAFRPSMLKRRCERQRNRHRVAALRLLIQGQWYMLEARDLGVDIPTVRGSARVASEHAGVDPADIGGVIRAYLLRSTLGPRPRTTSVTFTDVQISRFYAAHRKRYVTPDKRFVSAVIASTRRQIQHVRSQLEKGRPADQIVRSDQSRGLTLPFKGPLI